MNKELSEHPAFQYDLVIDKDEAYFGQDRDDIYDINVKARRLFNLVIKNGQKIMPNKTIHYYFSNIDESIKLDEAAKVTIGRIFKAV